MSDQANLNNDSVPPPVPELVIPNHAHMHIGGDFIIGGDDIHIQGEIHAAGNLRIESINSIQNQGQIQTTGDLVLRANNLINQGSFSADSITVEAPPVVNHGPLVPLFQGAALPEGGNNEGNLGNRFRITRRGG